MAYTWEPKKMGKKYELTPRQKGFAKGLAAVVSATIKPCKKYK